MDFLRRIMGFMHKFIASLFIGMSVFALNPASIFPLFNTFAVERVEAAVSVKGYYRKDGTYVRPHMRSNPDGIPTNNWSFPGNTNPYTGKTATGNPDTYLRNYYDRSPSKYPSFTVPTYTTPVFTAPSNPSCSSYGIFSRYNSLSSRCECMYGYVISNGKCVSETESCQDEFGFNATQGSTSTTCRCKTGYQWNTSRTACEAVPTCKYGYELINGKCISEEEDCQNEFGPNSTKGDTSTTCRCKNGYQWNLARTACVSIPNAAPYLKQNTSAAAATSSTGICGEHAFHNKYSGCICEKGYVREGGVCVFDKCPTGYEHKGSSCEMKTAIIDASQQKRCTSRIKGVCKCPSEYEPFGNRVCIPK
jgi:hypothetical protein